jgi:hypothetical protein
MAVFGSSRYVLFAFCAAMAWNVYLSLNLLRDHDGPTMSQQQQMMIHQARSGIIQEHTTREIIGGGIHLPPMIFGHVHMAKTAGTEINGQLAQRFERVCGNKGNSYDAISYNERVGSGLEVGDTSWKRKPDMISKLFKKDYNRGSIHWDAMKEVGFHDW